MGQLWLPTGWHAEVSCRDAIRQAQVTRVSSKGLNKLKQVRLKGSEEGAHKVFRDFGQSLPVKITRVKIDSKKEFPLVKFSSWLKYLIEYDELDRLAGTSDLKSMQKVLRTFWSRYKVCNADHAMFHANCGAALHPEMTIPLVHYGDEGRSKKKKQVMILASTPVLGKGSSRVQHDVSDVNEENPLNLNFLGDTYLTHFLSAVLPISLYNEQPESFHQVLAVLAEDFIQLFYEGLLVEGKRFYISVLGCKGDAPYLVKAGRFERSFTRRPVQRSSKKPSQGICHLCLAGKENHTFAVPFEEYGVEHPAWLATVGQEKPYQTPSEFEVIPFLKDGAEEGLEQFFQFDLFHNLHLGLGKCFAASAVCLCMELIDASISGAFEILTCDFQDYCKKNHESPYHKKLSASLFGVEGGFQELPDAAWNKGDFTRLILQWFADYCSREVVGKTEDPLYLLCVAYLQEINRSLFPHMYVEYFLPRSSAIVFEVTGVLLRHWTAGNLRLMRPLRSMSVSQGFTIKGSSSNRPQLKFWHGRACCFFAIIANWHGWPFGRSSDDFHSCRKAITYITNS